MISNLEVQAMINKVRRKAAEYPVVVVFIENDSKPGHLSGNLSIIQWADLVVDARGPAIVLLKDRFGE